MTRAHSGVSEQFMTASVIQLICDDSNLSQAFYFRVLVVVVLVPWCASWPFSASSVWCVWCCLDLKAPASSAAPGTAVVWHVCKHTSTGTSQQTSTSRKVRRHLHKQTPPEPRGRNINCSSYSVTVTLFYCAGKHAPKRLSTTCTRFVLLGFGFRCDFGCVRHEALHVQLAQCLHKFADAPVNHFQILVRDFILVYNINKLMHNKMQN